MTTKNIKLEEEIYWQLHDFMDKGETFSQAVERLLAARGEVNQLADILESQAKFKEWKRGQIKELTLA